LVHLFSFQIFAISALYGRFFSLLLYLLSCTCKRHHRKDVFHRRILILHPVESAYPVFFDSLFSFVVYLQGCFRFGDLAGGLYLSVHIALPYRPDS